MFEECAGLRPDVVVLEAPCNGVFLPNWPDSAVGMVSVLADE